MLEGSIKRDGRVGRKKYFLRVRLFVRRLGGGPCRQQEVSMRRGRRGREDAVIDSTNIFLECNYLDKHAVVLVKDDCLKMFSVIDHYFR